MEHLGLSTHYKRKRKSKGERTILKSFKYMAQEFKIKLKKKNFLLETHLISISILDITL